MKLAVLKERWANEARTPISPDSVKKYIALGFEVLIEAGAGDDASITDSSLIEVGAKIVDNPEDAIPDADIVLTVQRPLSLRASRRS